MKHDFRGRTQCPAQIYVTRLGDAANDIALSRLVLQWRQAYPRFNTLGGFEAAGIIDGRFESQSDVNQKLNRAPQGLKNRSIGARRKTVLLARIQLGL